MQSGNNASRALGGFLGLSVMGVGLSQISHPVGVALAAIGVARTVYSNLLGKGKEVSFLTRHLHSGSSSPPNPLHSHDVARVTAAVFVALVLQGAR